MEDQYNMTDGGRSLKNTLKKFERLMLCNIYCISIKFHGGKFDVELCEPLTVIDIYTPPGVAFQSEGDF